MLLSRLSRALFWFNPLSWLVFRMMKKEQEKACDELVLKAGIKPSTYAENLLSIRDSVPVHWSPPAAVLVIGCASSLALALGELSEHPLVLPPEGNPLRAEVDAATPTGRRWRCAWRRLKTSPVPGA